MNDRGLGLRVNRGGSAREGQRPRISLIDQLDPRLSITPPGFTPTSGPHSS